jgi:hypothetical protein
MKVKVEKDSKPKKARKKLAKKADKAAQKLADFDRNVGKGTKKTVKP